VALIPGFIVVALGIVLRLLFAATPFGSSFDFAYAVLKAPLTALVGENIWSLVVLNAIAGLIFAFGIHSGFITGMIAPILFGLDAMNQAAYAAGDPVPSVIGMAFSYITTVAVFYPAMAASVLIGAKSERMRTVGKLGLAPAIFGISEPLVFGLPVVFNPVLIVPYLVIPAVNQLVAYALMSAGIVARCSGVTVFNIPMIATGLMNGSLSIALMEIALFALDVVMLLPFIKVQDKQYLAEEQAANLGE
jgi:PTS system cellobiose-specific IIC component